MLVAFGIGFLPARKSQKHEQHKLAQHHRHGDVGASPFGSREIPGLKRALHQHHVLSLSCREAQSVIENHTSA